MVILVYMHKSGESLLREAEVIFNHDPVRTFERMELPVKGYLKLAQIRGERNPVTNELKDSILAEGLLYEPISARLSPELLREYVEFTNELWGADVAVEDLDHFRQDDGTYYLIIAGNSRHQAFDELIDEGRLPQNQILPTKMADVSSVWDIISLQRADNIHSAPPKERNAMATVEAYEWGRKQGSWDSVSEFVNTSNIDGKKISTKVMHEMRHFANLPGAIRTFILGGAIPYSVGIEMGKGASEIRRYYAVEAGYSSYDLVKMTPEDKEKIDSLTTLALNVDCVRMAQIKEAGGKFTVAAGKALVQGTVERYKVRADDASVKSGFMDELFEFADPLSAMIVDREKELKKQAKSLIATNQGDTEAFIRLHVGQGQLSNHYVAELAAALEHRAAEAQRVLKVADAARHNRDMGRTSIVAAATMAS